MRDLRYSFFALIFIIFSLLPASAQSGVQVVVVNEFANIRTIPAIGATVIATVPAGTSFDFITARSADNQWIRVVYSAEEGWVNVTPLAILAGDVLALPVADPRTIPYGGFDSPRSGFSDAVGSVTARVVTGLRLRAGPATAYPTLLSIPRNEGVALTGRVISNTWFQVVYNGMLGWVSGIYLEVINGDPNALPVDGIVAVAPPSTVDADTYFALLRTMRDRLIIAQPSLDAIRASWTNAALIGRAVCQAYPARPSNINIEIPLLAAYFDPLDSLQLEFNDAMFNTRYAIDLFIEVCNQPGTANPVGTATAQGALGVVNQAQDQFQRLRERLDFLIPPLVGPNQCALEYNGKLEVLPIIQPGTIYVDEFTPRSFATGYCFDSLEGQILNLQVLPIPDANVAAFVSVSPLDDPTNFVAVTRVTAGQKVTLSPLTIPRTTRYVIIIADLGDDTRNAAPQGQFAVRLVDITFATIVQLLSYDEETGAVILTTDPGSVINTGTSGDVTEDQLGSFECPSTALTCSQLGSCGEAIACLEAGNLSLDDDNDGTPCEALCGQGTGGNTTAPPPVQPTTQAPTSVCPSTSFNCNQLFTCEEANACLNAGNLTLDDDNDGIPCEATLCTSP
ncbi:MAG: SH3 domain-containing protein [Aggregatilineales bacterium]